MVETNEVEAYYSTVGIVDRILAALGPGPLCQDSWDTHPPLGITV